MWKTLVWSWVRKISWRRNWQPTPIFLPGESHGEPGRLYIVHGVIKSQTQLSNSHTHGCRSVTQSCLTLQPHGLQHARLPCPSPSPAACSNSSPLSGWCHPTILSRLSPSPPAFSLSQHQGLFQWVSSSHQVAKVLEFQHPSNEYSGLISFRIDWFDLRDSQESSPTPQF